jgi:hypothetical protein
MQLIKPGLISGEIITLMDEATEKLVLVSPYIDISKWEKILHHLREVQRRQVDIEIYIRENQPESFDEVRSVGITPFTILRLHTKLYFNERQAIVSSMNLLLSSDNHSLDIAVKTTTEQEYRQLMEYYELYIQKAAGQQAAAIDWKQTIAEKLWQSTGRKPRIYWEDRSLLINTGNRYEAFIDSSKTNSLRICGILSSKQFACALSSERLFPVQTPGLLIELEPGRKRHYDRVWATMPGLRSNMMQALNKADAHLVSASIVEFVSGVEEFKKKAG